MKSFSFGRQLSTNKALQVDIYLNKKRNVWFYLSCRWSRKEDHAGIYLDIEVLGFYLGLELHDTRHWDYESEQWVK